jgi:hypothetical protein
MRSFALAAFLLGLPCAAAAADWRAVPGAVELEADVASLERQASLVSAWVRYAGQVPAMQAFVVKPHAEAAPHYRTVLLARVDCHRRTLQSLATQGFRSDGKPVLMSSVPSAVLPVPDAAVVTALYDAICELARARPAETS